MGGAGGYVHTTDVFQIARLSFDEWQQRESQFLIFGGTACPCCRRFWDAKNDKDAAKWMAIGDAAKWMATGRGVIGGRLDGDEHRAARWGQVAQKPSAPIVWQQSLQAATTEARRSGKPILIVFGASWCSICKTLDEQVLTDAAVVGESQRWLMVRVDVDRQAEIAAPFGKLRVPTTVFLRPGPGPKLSFEGAPRPRDMVKVMQTAHARLQPN